MRRHLLVYMALAGALLAPAPHGHAGEIEIGGEGYAFALHDTGVPVFASFDPRSDGGVVVAPRPFALDGLGFRARAGVAFKDGAERVTVVVQRVSDAARDTQSSDFLGFTLELHERVEVALTTLDARFERRVTSSESCELRLQAGYRFARATQSQELSGSCPVCCFALARSDDRLTGHGLRAGFAGDVRLAGPLRLEAEGGLGLLRASDDSTTDFDFGDVLFLVPPDEGPQFFTRVEALDVRRSLATWDLSARLRADWKGLSLSAGWRFERWSQVTPLALGEEPGFDGFTFGLGWRFKL